MSDKPKTLGLTGIPAPELNQSITGSMQQVACVPGATEFERCTCECHTNPTFKHIRDCCVVCQNCGDQIKVEYQTVHLQHCHPHDAHGETLGGQ